jgi:hypothetical protein
LPIPCIAGPGSRLYVSGGGGAGFTFQSGWTAESGSFGSAETFTFNRGAADLGTGPTVLIYADFRDGTPGNVISLSATVGSFTRMTDSRTPNGDGPQKPVYATGPDGASWMNTLNANVIATDDWCLTEIESANYDSIYCSNRMYYDGSGTFDTSNQKDIWFTLDGDTDTTHDIYPAAYRGLFGNTSDAIYCGDSGGDNPGNDPPNGSSFQRLTECFRSFGVRPTVSAAYQAKSDVFYQVCDPVSGRYQDSSTNKESVFQNNVSPFAFNHIYLPGVYQDQQIGTHEAGPPYATYYLWNDILIQTGANAWKRFFITNAATLAASTLMYDCCPISWAGGQVSIRIPRGLSSYASKYLWYGNGMSYSLVGNS